MLAGKAALVTGAASGIGWASALAMAAAGARVLAADRDGEGAERCAAAIRAVGGEAVSHQADVTVEADVAAMVEAAVRQFGRLDCAFNNAGVAPNPSAELADVTEADWARVIGVNLTGVFLCLKHEILAMRGAGGGAIVNTASIAARTGLSRAAAYVAAKHGVMGLTRTAAMDHAKDGIRVNSVSPGYVRTPLAAAAIERRGETILARVPMGRLGLPEEIAEAVVWLCSDHARYITGEGLGVDGGYTAA